jgi:hypothetical protein
VTATDANGLVVATFAERPDLLAKVFEPEIQSAVPEFMRHDPAGDLYYGKGELGHYLDYGLVAVDPAEPDRPVARAFSVPFAFPDSGREVEERHRSKRRRAPGRAPDASARHSTEGTHP